MLGNYFYHEILRKTVISFGTLFNDIYIINSKNSSFTTPNIPLLKKV